MIQNSQKKHPDCGKKLITTFACFPKHLQKISRKSTYNLSYFAYMWTNQN